MADSPASTNDLDISYFETIAELGASFIEGDVLVLPVHFDDQPAYALCDQDETTGRTAVYALVMDEALLARVTSRDAQAVRLTRKGATE